MTANIQQQLHPNVHRSGTVHRISRFVIQGLLPSVVATGHLLAQTSPALRFTQLPRPNVEAGEAIVIAWQGASAVIETRYRLLLPHSQALYGVRAGQAAWSEWSSLTSASVSYSGFVVEGEYAFAVAGRKADGTTEQISTTFSVHFVMPATYDAAIRIDWNVIRQASSKAERCDRLAAAYRQQASVYRSLYDYRRRLLKLTVSPDELITSFAEVTVDESLSQLLEWADRGVAVTTGKILLPKLMYDVLKGGSLDLILVFRNVETNMAALGLITAEWAASAYQKCADPSAESRGGMQRAVQHWLIDYHQPPGNLEFSVTGGRLQGVIYSDRISGGNRIEGTLSGNHIEFRRLSEANQTWRGDLSLDGLTIAGTISWPGGSRSWTAHRRP